MKKLLLLCAVLVGLCAYAQDAPLYKATAYAYEAGYSGYIDFAPENPIPVEAYADYVILKSWAGVEGRDLAVGFNEDEAITYLEPFKDGESQAKYTTAGYTKWIYTGLSKDDDFYAMQVYMVTGYSNAFSDPETKSGYVTLMFYNNVSEASYYYVAWGEDEEYEVVGPEDNSNGWWTAWSQENIGFQGDGSLHYEFYNYTAGNNNWENWVLVLTNAPYTPNDGELYNGEQEVIVLRADAWGWGVKWNPENVGHNYNWDTFRYDMNGAWVEIDVTREGQSVDMHAVTYTVDDKEYTYDYHFDGYTEPYLGSFLTVECGHLIIYDAYVEEAAGVTSVANDANAPVVYYNLQGMPVNKDNMTTGIYIMRQGNSAQKVLIRK